MNPIKAALLILFAPRQFEGKAVQYALDYECGINDDFRQRYTAGQLAPDTLAKYRGTAAGQVAALRRVAGAGFLLCALTIAAGYAFGAVLYALAGSPPKWGVYVIQAIGASAILGATISSDPREIETFDRVSLPELVHEAFFRGLVALGTFIFVTSAAWDSFA